MQTVVLAWTSGFYTPQFTTVSAIHVFNVTYLHMKSQEEAKFILFDNELTISRALPAWQLCTQSVFDRNVCGYWLMFKGDSNTWNYISFKIDLRADSKPKSLYVKEISPTVI